jgi:hypothetical protein
VQARAKNPGLGNRLAAVAQAGEWAAKDTIGNVSLTMVG